MQTFITRRFSGLLSVATLMSGTILLSNTTAYAAGQTTGNDTGAVTYSGQLLLRIRTGAGGFTAVQRAEQVKERLGPILSLEHLTPDDVTVRQERPYQDASIYVRDRLLITVDRGLARANGNNDQGALARTWADRLRNILPSVSVKSQPPLLPTEPTAGSTGSVHPTSDENGTGKASATKARSYTPEGVPLRLLPLIDPRWT